VRYVDAARSLGKIVTERLLAVLTRGRISAWVHRPAPLLGRRAMDDRAIGWIAAIVIGGIAGWLAEQFMKSDTGLLRQISVNSFLTAKARPEKSHHAH
jgi:hypothetical protein